MEHSYAKTSTKNCVPDFHSYAKSTMMECDCEASVVDVHNYARTTSRIDCEFEYDDNSVCKSIKYLCTGM